MTTITADLNEMEDFEYSDLEVTIGSTLVSYGALAEMGMAVLNLAATTRLMRHATPAGTVEYAEAETGAQMLVRDFALWCSGDSEAGQRVIDYLNRSKWADMVIRSTDVTA